MQLDGRSLLAQDTYALRGEQPGDGFFRVRAPLVVPEAAENAVGRTKARERLDHFALRLGVPADEVPGQHDQVGFQLVGDRDATANLVRGHEGADVEIGKLGDAKALEGFGQARQPDAPVSDLHVEPAVEKPVGRGHERCGAYRNGRLLEEAAAGGRGQGDGSRLESGGVTCRSLARATVNPSCGARRAVYRPENHHQAEARPRPDQPPGESPYNQNAAQPRVGRAGYMTDSKAAEAVSEEEQIDNTRDDRKPGGPGLPGDESFPKVKDTANPEKLAGNKHNEDGEEEQGIEAPQLAGVYEQEGGKSKDQRENDDALVSSEETDHLCHLRAGNRATNSP